MPDAPPLDLVEEALDNLVNQFAKPLDFLRELVQNSIDAGSPRVDIWTSWSVEPENAERGVIEIHVDDHGDGMNEEIIDSQLTRMFASTKEDDLTKIGKFGIGFTSVFAIRPDAVLLRTGRHGESWELLFHADRSFDKTRCDEPMEGTQITLFKSVATAEVSALIRDCRWTLRYWCEHSDVPVTFEDRTERARAEPQAAADPFAAFASANPQAASAESVTSPLQLDAELQTEHRAEGIRVAIGYVDHPRYGFYNSGLTLVNTRSSDVLGPWASQLGHLGIKVKSRHLEHTLTRDNVLQDQNWDQAVAQVLVAKKHLREMLLQAIERRRDQSDALPRLLGWFALEALSDSFDAKSRIQERLFFPLVNGRTVSLKMLIHQASKEGCIYLGCSSLPLAQALERSGIHVLRNDEESRNALMALSGEGPTDFIGNRRPCVSADQVYVLPELLQPDQLDGESVRLLHHTQRLMSAATGDQIQLRLGDLGGNQDAAPCLAMQGPPEGGLFRRGFGKGQLSGIWTQDRCLLVDCRHPSWRTYRSACMVDPILAATGLAQLLLADEGTSRSPDFNRLYCEALEITEGSP